MKKKLFRFLLFLLFSFLTFTQLKAEKDIPAPDFRLPDLSGTTVELNSYRNNQAVLLLFWTTSCPYCLKEITVINDKKKNLQEKGIEVLAINAGESKARVERMVRNYRLDLEVLLDENVAVADAYGVLGVPTFVLIDKNGDIIFIGNSYPHEEIKELVLK